MRPSWKRGFVLATGLALLSLLFVESTYGMRTSITRGELLWNADEAFLVIGSTQQGWRRSVAQLGFDLVRSLLLPLVANRSQDSKLSIVFIRLTRDGMQRHVLEGDLVGTYTVADGHLYGGGWKWDGARFEKATAVENQRWAFSSQEYSDINGWSKRTALPMTTTAAGITYQLPLGGRAARLVVTGNEWSVGRIELHQNGDVQELWSLDGRDDWVTRAEYRRRFGR
jgi:hypothetical protein